MKIILLGLLISVAGISYSQQTEKATKTVVTTEQTENGTIEKISRTDSIKVKKINRKRNIVAPVRKEGLKQTTTNTKK